LKYLSPLDFKNADLSRLAWGAWIEIYTNHETAATSVSRLAWGAWIEILYYFKCAQGDIVAPRMGRVD